MTAFRATYRLQLGGDFGFAAARALVPYLRDLGVSHLYLPPSFQARQGSTHGYDVVDPTSISRELGGEEEFRALVDAVRDAGMGILLDIVPNHMAADDQNRWWADPQLREKFFDIDPNPAHPPGHRRFFDIDHLAGVRQEDPEVFATTHQLALRLVRDGVVDGLRIDHPDGLADPAGYLRRLRDGGAQHVWIEKILTGSHPPEKLRDWPVEGTVGYEFLNDVAALYVDPAGEGPLTALWEEVSGDARPFGEWADEAKLEQARSTFQPEVERLRRIADYPDLERALASLPVYRTYVEPWGAGASEEDRAVLAEAGQLDVLDQPAEFITRFQQTTPPVMAKGVEDTAFYRYLRLLALNDVGGDPSRFGIDVATFHAANLERAQRFPRNLLVTSTHDTKRSGDVRIRLAALSTMAEEYAAWVRRWRELTTPLKPDAGLDGIEELLVYQTLLGAWPLEPERLDAYLEKALREGKRTTSWIEPDKAHEAAVKGFARALYDFAPFREDFDPFQAEVARVGDRMGLGQTLLKLTVPGVPDIYQGDELLALSLVDPDNRRPVDWDVRREALAALAGGAAPTDATRKLWLIRLALDLRARRPEAFEGGYEVLDAGEDAIAFARGGDVVVAAVLRREPAQGAIELPAGSWRDVLGDRQLEGAQIALEELVGEHGIALLERA